MSSLEQHSLTSFPVNLSHAYPHDHNDIDIDVDVWFFGLGPAV